MDGVLQLSQVAGKRLTGTGLSSIRGARGLLWLEKAIRERRVLIGPKAMLDVVGRHTIVCVDLGIVNEMSLSVIVAKVDENGHVTCRYLNHLFRTVARYTDSGVEVYVRDRRLDVSKFDLEALANFHGRKLSAEEYEKYVDVITSATVGEAILADNYSEENLDKRAKLENRKRSHWCAMLNTILALVDAAERKQLTPEEMESRGAPIIVVGRPTFKSSMRRKRPAAPKKIIDYLKRFFAVVVIDEFNTSKLCHKCHRQLQRHSTRGYRLWKCSKCKDAKGGNLVVHKDISATLAMFKIFTYLLATGARPPQYCRPRSS